MILNLVDMATSGAATANSAGNTAVATTCAGIAMKDSIANTRARANSATRKAIAHE